MKPLYLETQKPFRTVSKLAWKLGTYESVPRIIGEGVDRAAERIAKHRERWADTPVKPRTGRVAKRRANVLAQKRLLRQIVRA